MTVYERCSRCINSYPKLDGDIVSETEIQCKAIDDIKSIIVSENDFACSNFIGWQGDYGEEKE